jgi:hypothetical protein
LLAKSALAATKRHWHKLFRGGAQPSSAEEAGAALAKRFGSLAAALEVARKS